MTLPDPEPSEIGCEDCGALDNLSIVWADFGAGAFLALLCDTCWHRRQYRAELKDRRDPR